MHRFYAPGLILDHEIDLPPDEAHHLARVMRLKPGDKVAVFDGRGNEAVASVQTIAGRRVAVKPIERRTAAREPAIAIRLAQALLKSDKMDRVIRDAVMLGVAAIQPFVSARTEVPKAAWRSGSRQDRWERTVISSVKQCGRSVVPPVLPAVDFQNFLAADRDTLRLMFVEPGITSVASSPESVGRNFSCADLKSFEMRVPSKATVLIGPEGGWEPQEVAEAVAAGVELVTFGQRTLRADAAGVVAVALLQYIWKDL